MLKNFWYSSFLIGLFTCLTLWFSNLAFADFPSVPAQQFYTSWIFSGQVFQEDRLFPGRESVAGWSAILSVNLSGNTLNCFYDVNASQPKLAYKLWSEIIYWTTLMSDQDTRCIYPIEYIEDVYWNKDYWSVYQSWFLWWGSSLPNPDWTHYFKVTWLNNIDFYYETTGPSSFTWMTFEESFIQLNELLSWYINKPLDLIISPTSFVMDEQLKTDITQWLMDIIKTIIFILSIAILTYMIKRFIEYFAK